MLLKKVSFLDERKRSFVIKFFDAKFASETARFIILVTF